ncbi:MAG: response regulator [Paracoccaceae bacterium]
MLLLVTKFLGGFLYFRVFSDTGTFTDSPLGHLLVVDDDREIREILIRFLSKQGYRVSAAADGVEMWQVLSDWKIDLVIPDLMLPGEDGLSICRNLRAYSQVPIVMLTVVGEESQRSRTASKVQVPGCWGLLPILGHSHQYVFDVAYISL